MNHLFTDLQVMNHLFIPVATITIEIDELTSTTDDKIWLSLLIRKWQRNQERLHIIIGLFVHTTITFEIFTLNLIDQTFTTIQTRFFCFIISCYFYWHVCTQPNISILSNLTSYCVIEMSWDMALNLTNIPKPCSRKHV